MSGIHFPAKKGRPRNESLIEGLKGTSVYRDVCGSIAKVRIRYVVCGKIESEVHVRDVWQGMFTDQRLKLECVE